MFNINFKKKKIFLVILIIFFLRNSKKTNYLKTNFTSLPTNQTLLNTTKKQEIKQLLLYHNYQKKQIKNETIINIILIFSISILSCILLKNYYQYRNKYKEYEAKTFKLGGNLPNIKLRYDVFQYILNENKNIFNAIDNYCNKMNEKTFCSFIILLTNEIKKMKIFKKNGLKKENEFFYKKKIFKILIMKKILKNYFYEIKSVFSKYYWQIAIINNIIDNNCEINFIYNNCKMFLQKKKINKTFLSFKNLRLDGDDEKMINKYIDCRRLYNVCKNKFKNDLYTSKNNLKKLTEHDINAFYVSYINQYYYEEIVENACKMYRYHYFIGSNIFNSLWQIKYYDDNINDFFFNNDFIALIMLIVIMNYFYYYFLPFNNYFFNTLNYFFYRQYFKKKNNLYYLLEKYASYFCYDKNHYFFNKQEKYFYIPLLFNNTDDLMLNLIRWLIFLLIKSEEFILAFMIKFTFNPCLLFILFLNLKITYLSYYGNKFFNGKKNNLFMYFFHIKQKIKNFLLQFEKKIFFNKKYFLIALMQYLIVNLFIYFNIKFFIKINQNVSFNIF